MQFLEFPTCSCVLGVSVKSRIRLKGGFAFDGQDGSRDFPSSLSPPHFCSSFDTQAKQAQQRGETHTRHGLTGEPKINGQRNITHMLSPRSDLLRLQVAGQRLLFIFDNHNALRHRHHALVWLALTTLTTDSGLSYTIAVFRLGRTRHPLRSSPHRFFHPQQCYQGNRP